MIIAYVDEFIMNTEQFNRNKHEMMKSVRISEECLMQLEYDSPTDLQNIISLSVLYDYDRAFLKYFSRYQLIFSRRMDYNQRIICFMIVDYVSRNCLTAFVKEYGYNELLVAAVFRKNVEISEYCLKNGANPNYGYIGMSSLFCATYDIFCLLIDYGADIDVVNLDGKTLCEMIFTWGGSKKKAEKILDSGFKVPQHLLDFYKNLE